MTDWSTPEWRVSARHVRSASAADVHLVCGVGPYELDVLVRRQAAAPNLQVVGQVTRAGKIFEPVPALALALLPEGTAEPCADTRTDEFGEFDLVTETRQPCGLRLGDGHDAPRVLLWDPQEVTGEV